MLLDSTWAGMSLYLSLQVTCDPCALIVSVNNSSLLTIKPTVNLIIYDTFSGVKNMHFLIFRSQKVWKKVLPNFQKPSDMKIPSKCLLMTNTHGFGITWWNIRFFELVHRWYIFYIFMSEYLQYKLSQQHTTLVPNIISA